MAGLEAFLGQLDPSPALEALPIPASQLVKSQACDHKESLFYGLSPLGSHLDDKMKSKIWENQYVHIWSLDSVDQHTVDNERRPHSDRFVDQRPKVAHAQGDKPFPC